MPKVSSYKTYVKDKDGNLLDFTKVIFYDPKNKRFTIALPDCWAQTINQGAVSGYSQDEAEANFNKAQERFEKLLSTKRKVIIYKFGSKAEIGITKEGKLIRRPFEEGWSTQPDFQRVIFKTDWGYPHGMSGKGTALDIYYAVVYEVKSPLEKELNYLTEGGRHVCNSDDRELKVMEWTPEREDFFQNFDMELTMMIYKLSNFLNGDAACMATLIDTVKDYKSLPAPPEPKKQETTN